MKIAIVLLAGCAASSPLAEIGPQVEVSVDTTRTPSFELSVTTWNNLSALSDAMDAHQIVATLDGRPLAVDPIKTGSYGQGGSYVAAFDGSAAGLPRSATDSAIEITDGITSWQVAIPNLFAADLAPTAPLAAGTNTFEWPSAAMADDGQSLIAWACVEVAGTSAVCTSDITQQFITTDIAGNSGDDVVITAQRDVAAESSGPTFLTQIFNHYEATLP